MLLSAQQDELVQASRHTQDRTLAALDRCDRNVSEAEGVADATLVELGTQDETLAQIETNLERARVGVRRADRLCDRMDLWRFDFFHRSRAAARRALRSASFSSPVISHRRSPPARGVWERQRWCPHRRTFCAEALLSFDGPPFSEVRATAVTRDRRGPRQSRGWRALADVGEADGGVWRLDTCGAALPCGTEGWSYALAFSRFKHGGGTAKPSAQTLVRKRRWLWARSRVATAAAVAAAVGPLAAPTTARSDDKEAAAADENGDGGCEQTQGKNTPPPSRLPSTLCRMPPAPRAAAAAPSRDANAFASYEVKLALAEIDARDRAIDARVAALATAIGVLDERARTIRDAALDQGARLCHADERLDGLAGSGGPRRPAARVTHMHMMP